MKFRILLWLSMALPCLLLAQIVPKTKQQLTDSTMLRNNGYDSKRIDTVLVVGSRPLEQQLLDRVRIRPGSNPVLLNGNTFAVLNAIPSIEVDELGNLSLQGKTGVLITINGKQTYLTGTSLVGYLKSIPASSLESIDLMTIPSAKWSAEGAGGVIDIRLKKDVLKGLKGNVYLGASKGRLWKYNNGVSLQYGMKRWSLNSSFSVARSSNYFDVDRKRELAYSENVHYVIGQLNKETNNTQELNGSLGINYRIDKQSSVELNWNYLRNNYEEIGVYQNDFSVDGTLKQATASTSNLRNPLHRNSINLHYDFAGENKDKALQLDFDYLRYSSIRKQDLKTRTVPFFSEQQEQQQFLRSNNPFYVDLFGIKGDFQRKLSGPFSMEAGFQANRSQRQSYGHYQKGEKEYVLADDDSLENTFKQTEYLEAIYTDFQLKLAQWEIKLGVRAEYAQFQTKIDYIDRNANGRKQMFNLFPTLFGIYRIDKDKGQAVQVAYGRRISRPNYQDLYPSIFFFDPSTSYQGNAQLSPQLSDNMDLKYVHGQKWNIGLSLINHRNYISMVHQVSEQNYTQTYQNIASVKSAAISMNMGKAIVKNLMLYGFGQIQYVHYKNIPTELNDLLIHRGLWSFQSNLMMQLNLPYLMTVNWTNSYRTNVLYAQTIIKPLYEMHLAVSKQFSNALSLALTARDLFHSRVLKREILGQGFNIYSKTVVDSRIIGLNFNYTFGPYKKQKIKQTSIEGEVSRL